MRVTLPLLLLLSTGCATSKPATKTENPALRDAEAYALASCFAKLQNDYLRSQGDAWAGAIIQRGAGELEPLLEIASAVATEMEATPMAIGRDEANPQTGKELPLLYCFELVAHSRIRASIATSAAELEADYRAVSSE